MWSGCGGRRGSETPLPRNSSPALLELLRQPLISSAIPITSHTSPPKQLFFWNSTTKRLWSMACAKTRSKHTEQGTRIAFLTQVLHLRPTAPSATPPSPPVPPARPVWRCACGGAMVILRRRMRADAVAPCAAPQTECPDKAGPVEAYQH